MKLGRTLFRRWPTLDGGRAAPVTRSPLGLTSAVMNVGGEHYFRIDPLIEAKQSMADKPCEYRRSLISVAVTGKFKVPGV